MVSPKVSPKSQFQSVNGDPPVKDESVKIVLLYSHASLAPKFANGYPKEVKDLTIVSEQPDPAVTISRILYVESWILLLLPNT